MKTGIPENAFKEVTGDTKGVAKQFRDLNKKEIKDLNQYTFRFEPTSRFASDMKGFVLSAKALGQMADTDAATVNLKQAAYWEHDCIGCMEDRPHGSRLMDCRLLLALDGFERRISPHIQAADALS